MRDLDAESTKRLVEAIDTLFAQIVPPTTPEEIDAELREAGYDPDEVAEKFRKIAADALEKAAAERDGL